MKKPTTMRELRDFRLYPFPTKPEEFGKIAREGHGTVLWAISSDGHRVCTNAIAFRGPGQGRGRRIGDLGGDRLAMCLDGLKRLGVATGELVEAYAEHRKGRRKRIDARHALEYHVGAIEKLGVPVGVTVKRKLAKLAGRDEE